MLINSLSKRLRYGFAVIGVFLILLPKINIISVSGQTAGLRIDDLVMFFLFLVYFFLVLKEGKINAGLGYVLFCVYIMISTLVIVISGRPANFLYCIRLVEYFIFFVFGWCCFGRINIVNVFWLIFLCNACIMTLQTLGFIGGFSSEGYASSIPGRPIGLTGGPWEVGFLINCAYAVFRLSSAKYKNIIFLLTFIFVLITGARMPTLTHIIIFFMFEFYESKNKLLSLIVYSIFLSVLLFFLLAFDNPVADRSSNLFSMNNIDVFRDFYNSITITDNFVEFPEFPVEQDADMSWLMRVSKWAYVIKTWISSLGYIFFGVGVGTWGTALDGGWLRLLTETGLFGLFMFCVFLRNLINVMHMGYILVAVFSINMFMIDIFISYKSMAALLFICGYFVSASSSVKIYENYNSR
ncbi:MAG: hypothetical protein PHV54_01365 [Tolumonas sp.]|nr:hypothetical protein [Tolumonas sp.]